MSEERRVLETCRVSPWFHQRMVLVALLICGLSAFFLYDGYLGYPKHNQWVEQYEAFDPAVAGKSWAEYAASFHKPAAPPEAHPEAAIAQQKRIGFLGFALLAVLLGWWVRQARKSWALLEGDRLRTPGGQLIQRDQIEEADFSKWDRGLAILSGSEIGRVKVDDYQYAGIGAVLKRWDLGPTS